ncbi:prolyl oligopeptidase family serine peptidase [Hirschia baltica]|uniref:Prolyl oligopeptidase n=1 Tax=Hirschia baltica (strain ATCC 49814 / DSM 5838 / IFAM 1418) TaxID=582402 RepID=C6XKY3_HIRBI|nr:Prolyl oligopeptidase [Hirschia baltica ATCC 49814]
MKKIILSAAILLAVACSPQENTTDMNDKDTAKVIASHSDLAFDSDQHLFLEEVEGEQALDWVKGENERSLARLKADPRFAVLEKDALDIVNAKERIPYGTVRDGFVYNFWQDETNVRGLWRKASLESYKSDTPVWETVLDFDALAKAEDKNWVFKGSNCFKPKGEDDWGCMVSLSDGGKDAVVQREFDLASKTFVESGFATHEAKQGIAWADADTLLIATDWGDVDGVASVTESGYPYILKRWTRGTPLETAETILNSSPTVMGVWPMTFELEDGRVIQSAMEAESFFSFNYWLFPEDGSEAVKWPIPKKSTPQGIYAGQFLLTLEADWDVEGQGSFKQGDLVAFDVNAFLETKTLPSVSLVMRPKERQAIGSVSLSKDALLISYNDNVAGKVMSGDLVDGDWTFSPVALPDNGNAGIAFASKDESDVFLNYEGFLNPDSLYAFDAKSGEVTLLKSLPPKFDASPYVVEQFESTSKDGTKVPYFVVRAKETDMDGSTPTLLYGYGGFQISLNPSYSAFTGKLWLDNGGAYVLANIRGGGEFGPAWHQAGLKLKRQVVYDDFISVAEDIIGKGLTSPDKLGIMGGSNGGLLMGVMFTQRPDLFSAVVCQVPLLDMLRYHTMLAGASWMDEYGDPSVPEEREWLEKLSPYHNIDPSTDYPEIFFVTSTKDDRVHPAHARKMAHRLQDLEKPFLYYENIDGGHSAAANLKESANRRALEMTYLMQKLMDTSAQ